MIVCNSIFKTILFYSHFIHSQQDEKQRFSSVLLLARLLAKFLGFISFLPYQTAEKPSREIQEAAVALRIKVRN